MQKLLFGVLTMGVAIYMAATVGSQAQADDGPPIFRSTCVLVDNSGNTRGFFTASLTDWRMDIFDNVETPSATIENPLPGPLGTVIDTGPGGASDFQGSYSSDDLDNSPQMEYQRVRFPRDISHPDELDLRDDQDIIRDVDANGGLSVGVSGPAGSGGVTFRDASMRAILDFDQANLDGAARLTDRDNNEDHTFTLSGEFTCGETTGGDGTDANPGSKKQR